MAHINRRFIDKHWLMYIIRGAVAGVFGVCLLFGGLNSFEGVVATLCVFLLFMGIVDSAGALYSTSKKHGWLNSVIDAAIDIVAALTLMFAARGDLVLTVSVLSVYTIVSGIIDVFHGFLSTVDPTDRFIRVLVGAFGCVMGAVILNSGSFEEMTFVRFFGAYMLVVAVTSMIYGVHNRAQGLEDKIARSEARSSKKTSKKVVKKKGRK